MKIIEYIFSSLEKWYNVGMTSIQFSCGCSAAMITYKGELIDYDFYECLDHCVLPKSNPSSRTRKAREVLFNRFFAFCPNETASRKRRNVALFDICTLS